MAEPLPVWYDLHVQAVQSIGIGKADTVPGEHHPKVVEAPVEVTEVTSEERATHPSSMWWPP